MTSALPQTEPSASPSSAELILLPPEAADGLSEVQLGWLRSALQDDPRVSLAGTLEAVRAERAQLWGVRVGAQLRALLVTWIGRYEQCDVLEVQLIGGEGMAEWLGLLPELERHACNLGCRLMELRGRRGWERVLPGYRMRGVCLEKDLA